MLYGLGLHKTPCINAECMLTVQIGETSNAELDSIIQQVKHVKYKGNARIQR